MNSTKLSYKPTFRAACLMLVVILLAALVGAALAAPGDLDITYDADGKTSTSVVTGQCLSNSGDCAQVTVIQGDDKLILGGDSRNYSQNRHDFTLVRYNLDGSIDTSFDSDGIVQTTFGGSGIIQAMRALAIQQHDNKILAGGQSLSDFAVARFNLDGSLDTTFSGDGKVTTSIVSGGFDGGDFVTGLVTQPSNHYIIAAGFTASVPPAPPPTESDIVLVRYTDTGALDASFGSGGISITSLLPEPSHDEAYAVALQPDGKIVAVGMHRPTKTTGNEDFAIQRFEINGTLDPTFDIDGSVVTTITAGDDQARAVAIQPDGKILVAGIAGNHFALVRYNADGSLDTSFGGGDGIVTTASENLRAAFGMTIQPNGQIVLAGYANPPGNDNFAMARYNYDGTPDTTLGGDGVIVTDFLTGQADQGRGVAIQRRDGKIVVGGQADTDATATINDDYAAIRYLNDLEATITGVTNGQTAGVGGTNVSVTLNSGGPCDFTSVKHPVPPGGAPASPGELPVYWTLTTTCTNYNLDLVFTYTDVELLYGNNVNEALLVAYKSTDGSTWINQGGTVNLGANTVTVTGVTSLSDWALASNAPTAVTMAGFGAWSELGQVRIEWQTALEIDVIGFNLYRASSLEGEQVLLNKTGLLEPQGIGGLSGAEYVYLDQDAVLGTLYYYWLETISLDGVEVFGPMLGQSLTGYFLPFIRR